MLSSRQSGHLSVLQVSCYFLVVVVDRLIIAGTSPPARQPADPEIPSPLSVDDYYQSVD